ncbi:Hypothetical predicted protein [Paramuricea clavata]|uniref:Uncharacterized protein n=1 Tax=Paramuricea clavata TaxID=317549 RepID=A0A7D9DYS4_PARCT|nr:Hypothetical predicted protein [Paramuricea clavata]
MKKITVYVEDGGVTLELQDPFILTHGSELYVKTAAVFGTIRIFLKEELEENGLTFKGYPDGRIRMDFAKGTGSTPMKACDTSQLAVTWRIVSITSDRMEIGVPSSLPFPSMEPDLSLEPQPNTMTLKAKYGWMLASTMKSGLKSGLIPELFPEMSY